MHHHPTKLSIESSKENSSCMGKPTNMMSTDSILDDEIVFEGRRLSDTPVIIITACSSVGDASDTMSGVAIGDLQFDPSKEYYDVNLNEVDDSISVSPSSVYSSIVASSVGGVTIPDRSDCEDTLASSYRRLITPNDFSAGTITDFQGETSSGGYSGSGNGSVSTKAARIARQSWANPPGTSKGSSSLTSHEADKQFERDPNNKAHGRSRSTCDRVVLGEGTRETSKFTLADHITSANYFVFPAAPHRMDSIASLDQRLRIEWWINTAVAGNDAIHHNDTRIVNRAQQVKEVVQKKINQLRGFGSE